MLVREVSVNDSVYVFTLTDQIIGQVNRLRNLYDLAYSDPESFEHISAEIAGVVSNISEAVEPRASDNDLDGVLQEIMRIVDNRKAEVEKLSRKRRIQRKTGRKTRRRSR